MNSIFVDSAATVLVIESSRSRIDGVSALGIRKTFGKQARGQRKRAELVDWRTELEAVQDGSGFVTPRARTEARSWLLARALTGPVASDSPTTFLIAGDPTHKDFLSWLITIKSSLTVPEESGDPRPWAIRCAVTLPDWGAALNEYGLIDAGLPGLTWPKKESETFIWSRTSRRQIPP